MIFTLVHFYLTFINPTSICRVYFFIPFWEYIIASEKWFYKPDSTWCDFLNQTLSIQDVSYKKIFIAAKFDRSNQKSLYFFSTLNILFVWQFFFFSPKTELAIEPLSSNIKSMLFYSIEYWFDHKQKEIRSLQKIFSIRFENESTWKIQFISNWLFYATIIPIMMIFCWKLFLFHRSWHNVTHNEYAIQKLLVPIFTIFRFKIVLNC